MKVLGIETSCDETAAAVIEFTESQGLTMLSNVVASSIDQHIKFGGVVPEIAARSHIESITPVINQALLESKYGQTIAPHFQGGTLEMDKLWDNIDAIAVTRGPGLGGSLLVGVLSARTLAITQNKPLYAINHVQAHVYANFITKSPLLGYTLPTAQPAFPLVALIVSGGHSQLVLFRDVFDYQLLGQTHDDAVGEAFDKVAKILGLPYPGGPSISKLANRGNPVAFKLPKAKVQDKYGFSFSGLKTALLRAAQKEVGEDFNFPSHLIAERLNDTQKADFAASFQHTAIETLVDKLVLACQEHSPKSVVIAGGVAANQELRKQAHKRLSDLVTYTDTKLCTDNGAMIATAGCFAIAKGAKPADPFSLEIDPGLSM